jgi:NAD(P)-dependent dehydrogenase (short-subunit alcohol dehydrogenase family)
MAIRFDGKVAIVTGAGGGLGRAHALELARRGAKVVVNDLGGAVDGSGGSSEAAKKVVDEIKALGGQAVANGGSVSDRAGAQSIVKDAVHAFGTVDILINNAGILRDKTFAKMPLDDFELVVKVHLLGSVYCTQAAWPVMADKGYGRIVMTTSSSGLYGNFGQSNYGAAKMGLVGLMNTLKIEGGRKGIKVNTIAPVAATRMTADLGMPEEAFKALKPELVTPAVLFLCSDDAPSGAIIEAGAGYFAGVQVMEGKGVHLGADATVDDVAAAYERIADMREATPFTQGAEVTQKIFATRGR